MLGFKSLAQKLRDGNGQEAPATVVEFDKGRSINWTSRGVDGQPGVTLQQGTASKDRYRLRVDPPGERSLEVEVKIPEDKLFGLYGVGVDRR